MNDAKWYEVRFFSENVGEYGVEGEEIYGLRMYVKARDMDEVINYVLENEILPEYRDYMEESESGFEWVEYMTSQPTAVFDPDGNEIDLEEFDMDMDEALEKGYSFVYEGFEIMEMEEDFEPPEWWRPLTDLTKTENVRGYSVRESTIVKTESKKPMPKKVIKPCDCD